MQLVLIPAHRELIVVAYPVSKVWDNETGRLEAEYWYSPEVRWFVKTIIYDSTSGFAKEEKPELRKELDKLARFV